MKEAKRQKRGVTPTKDRWASDVIVDLLHAYELPHAALNRAPPIAGCTTPSSTTGATCPR